MLPLDGIPYGCRQAARFEVADARQAKCETLRGRTGVPRPPADATGGTGRPSASVRRPGHYIDPPARAAGPERRLRQYPTVNTRRNDRSIISDDAGCGPVWRPDLQRDLDESGPGTPWRPPDGDDYRPLYRPAARARHARRPDRATVFLKGTSGPRGSAVAGMNQARLLLGFTPSHGHLQCFQREIGAHVGGEGLHVVLAGRGAPAWQQPPQTLAADVRGITVRGTTIASG